MSRYRYPSAAFENYWTMWNTCDLEQAWVHLQLAVTEDFEFCDPVEHHFGRDGLMANVRGFRAQFPDASFELRSGFDTHHNRYRYRWNMVNEGRVVVQGTDIATVADSGLLQRIDGFFGRIPALRETLG